MQIRDEAPEDLQAVRTVNTSAFETSAEADLVDALRRDSASTISLVAEDDGEVVGHIMFSPATLSDHPATKIMGLAPMAVLPQHQRKGIGSALVMAGLERCTQLDFDAVIVLGHPEYYPRFGFTPSRQFDIVSEYDVPDEVFMVLELLPDALKGKSGTVKYHPAFGAL